MINNGVTSGGEIITHALDLPAESHEGLIRAQDPRGAAEGPEFLQLRTSTLHDHS